MPTYRQIINQYDTRLKRIKWQEFADKGKSLKIEKVNIVKMTVSDCLVQSKTVDSMILLKATWL